KWARHLRHGQRCMDRFLHRGSGGALRHSERRPRPRRASRRKHSGSDGVSGNTPRVRDWAALFEHERAPYADREARLGDGADEREGQRARMGNAAWGAGLCLLMQGEASARDWLGLAAARWRESYADAPPGSWGRPIGAIKALVLADDWAGAEDAARWAL